MRAASTLEVAFDRQNRVPLLFITFGEDHLMPPKVGRHMEDKYDDAVSITERREFPGRPHFPSVPGWEEVADYALTWTLDHALTSVSGHSADAQMKPVKATGTPSMLRPQRPCADQRTGDLADPTPNRISRQSERGRLRGQRADTRWLVFAAKAVDHKMSHHSRGGGRGASRNRGG